MELDEDLFLWSIKTTFKEFKFIKTDNYYFLDYNPNSKVAVTIKIFIGDGRKTIPLAYSQNLLPKFTAIFQDAFSPKKNPALWTVEWFLELKRLSSLEVYLSTYSASVSVRKSMLVAGWHIENCKGFGQKRTMTKGRLIGSTDNGLSAELKKSPTLELHDN
jgi:tRNA U34 5-methylaminomethyl-2-thiouridine-forming methyltransferase MnmC